VQVSVVHLLVVQVWEVMVQVHSLVVLVELEVELVVMVQVHSLVVLVVLVELEVESVVMVQVHSLVALAADLVADFQVV
jgi:hypothetical protein